MKTRIALIILLALTFQVKVCGQATASGAQLILSTRPATSLDLPANSHVEEKQSLQELHEILAELDRQIAELEQKKAAAVSRYFEEGAVQAQRKEPQVCLDQNK